MSYKEHRVLVIGAAGLDMKVRPRIQAVEPHRSNPGRIRAGWGGVARNVAENLARLGADVYFITAVGDDFWGHALLDFMKSLDIDVQHALISPEHTTGAYMGLYHTDAHLWFAFDDMSVMQTITPGHLHALRGFFKTVDMVCIDANLSARALKTLFRITSQYEIPVCVDPTTAMLSHRLHPYLPEITVITPDRDEAEALVGEPLDNEEAITHGARRLVQLGVDLAIITLGAEGLFYATHEESGRVPAFPVEMVDPVGAGDALTAAVAYALMEDVSPEEAVRLGMAAATQTILCHETVCPHISLEMLYDRLT